MANNKASRQALISRAILSTSSFSPGIEIDPISIDGLETGIVREDIGRELEIQPGLLSTKTSFLFGNATLLPRTADPAENVVGTLAGAFPLPSLSPELLNFDSRLKGFSRGSKKDSHVHQFPGQEAYTPQHVSAAVVAANLLA